MCDTNSDDITMGIKDKHKVSRSESKLARDMISKFILDKDKIIILEKKTLKLTKITYKSCSRSIDIEIIYRDSLQNLIANLDHNSEIGSDYLATIINGEPIEFCKELDVGDPSQLCPQRWKNVKEKLEDITNIEKVYADESKDLNCTRCAKWRKKRGIKGRYCYETRQIRSADEGATMIIKCMICSKVWRMS